MASALDYSDIILLFQCVHAALEGLYVAKGTHFDCAEKFFGGAGRPDLSENLPVVGVLSKHFMFIRRQVLIIFIFLRSF